MPAAHSLINLRLFARTLQAAQTVLEGRLAAERILRGDDDRLLVVVGYVNPPQTRSQTKIIN
jgi:phospho-2-dehydro-3-deoxyheptonate aldolase